jgi:hypothetical protein
MVLSLIAYIAPHFGSRLSSALNRAAVVNVGSEEVLRGMCSLSYQSEKVSSRIVQLSDLVRGWLIGGTDRGNRAL